MKERIQGLIDKHSIFLFMKGEKDRPLCGFSAQVVSLLNLHNVEFESFNILTDEAMRSAVKEFSNWPTYPQLYVKRKFVGGCDILVEMHENGELESIFK